MGDSELRSVGVMLPTVEAVVLVGESFSSAMRGKSSPGCWRFRSNAALPVAVLPISPEEGEDVDNDKSKLISKVSAQASSSVKVETDCIVVVDGGIDGCEEAATFVRQIPPTGRCFWTFVLTGVGEGELDDEVEGLAGDGAPVQSGDMDEHLLSALRGWSRSGDRALRSKGELGSALLGRANGFLPVPAVFNDGTTEAVPLVELDEGADGWLVEWGKAEEAAEELFKLLGVLVLAVGPMG